MMTIIILQCILGSRYNISNTTGATCRAGSAYPSEAPEITPSFWWGLCCLFFSFLCCVMFSFVCLFVFFHFSPGVVSLFSIYEFDCPSDIFRRSFRLNYSAMYFVHWLICLSRHMGHELIPLSVRPSIIRPRTSLCVLL